MHARPPAPPLDRLLAHREWVRTMARHLAGNAFDADDLEQDAWLAAMRARPADGPGIRAWFARVMQNRRRNAHRDDANRLGRESASAPDDATRSTASVVAEAEAHRRVVDAVLDLPSPHREAVLLRYFEGLPPREIAMRTDAPVETVRTRLKRAAELLRTALGRGDGDAWLGALAPLIAPPRAVPSSVHVAGGLAMKVSTMLAAAAFLLVATGAAWIAFEGGPAPRADVVAQAPAAASTVDRGSAKTPPTRRAEKTPAEVAAVVAPEDELPPPVDFAKVDRDLDLHGTVVDADGRGIPGARIATVTYPWRVGGVLNARDYDVEVAGPKTRSARDGTFALRLARGESVALRVAASGLASVELPKVAAGERIRVVLRPGVRLVVSLLDSAGAPVAGADVRLFNGADRDGSIAVRARGVTVADGTCAFDGLPPSAWAWIDPRQTRALISWTRVELPATGELRKEIRLPEGRTLVGTVVDADTHHAIEGAKIGMGWELDMPTTSKSDGTFVLPGWTATPTTSYPEIHVLADGYARASKVVGPGDRLDFELHRGWAANGRVVADGRPVSGARVSVIGYEQVGRTEERMSIGHAVSDEDGRFRVAGLTCGMRHVLVVMADGFARVRRETLPPRIPADVPLGDVALVAARRLEGVLLSDDGVPQPRVSVYAGDSRTMERTSLPHGYGGGSSCFTDDLGRFRFTDVAPGAYTLTARSPAAPENSRDVKVPADADLLDVRFRCMPTRPLVVTVVDSSRVVLAGARVESSNSRNQSVSVATDATGIARLNVPSEMKARLSVSHGAVGEREFLGRSLRELRDDETDVTVVLEDAAFVTGRLVDESGAPVANASLSTFKAGESSSGTVTDADGRFRVLVSREGTTDLVFDGQVNRGGRYENSGLYARADGVSPGGDVTLTCRRVDTSRKLTVVVVSPTGDPLNKAIVHVFGSAWPGRTARTDASGRAEIADLPACELSVMAGPAIEDDLTGTRPVKLVPEGQEIRLVCRAAVWTKGKVVDEHGVAISYGAMRVVRGGEVIQQSGGAVGGVFWINTPADEPAAFRVELDIDGDGSFETKLDDVRPGTQGVRVVATK